MLEEELDDRDEFRLVVVGHVPLHELERGQQRRVSKGVFCVDEDIRHRQQPLHGGDLTLLRRAVQRRLS